MEKFYTKRVYKVMVIPHECESPFLFIVNTLFYFAVTIKLKWNCGKFGIIKMNISYIQIFSELIYLLFDDVNLYGFNLLSHKIFLCANIL